MKCVYANYRLRKNVADDKQIPYGNYMKLRYFTLAATDLKPQQMPMFLNISGRAWGRRWSPHTSEQKGCILKP